MKQNLFIILLIILANNLFAQTEIKYSDVVNTTDSVKQAALYERAKSWIMANYKNDGNILRFDDEGKGSISASIYIPTKTKSFLWNLLVCSSTDNAVKFNIEIGLKDNKYKYDMTEVKYTFYRVCATPIAEEWEIDKIQGMPKKQIAEAKAEAEKVVSDFIANLKKVISAEKMKSDW